MRNAGNPTYLKAYAGLERGLNEGLAPLHLAVTLRRHLQAHARDSFAGSSARNTQSIILAVCTRHVNTFEQPEGQPKQLRSLL
jgi:hypothetical protein